MFEYCLPQFRVLSFDQHLKTHSAYIQVYVCVGIVLYHYIFGRSLCVRVFVRVCIGVCTYVHANVHAYVCAGAFAYASACV